MLSRNKEKKVAYSQKMDNNAKRLSGIILALKILKNTFHSTGGTQPDVNQIQLNLSYNKP